MVKSPEKKGMRFYLFVWILGLSYTLIKGKLVNFIGGGFFDLDFLTIMIACFLLYYGHTGAGCFAFGQGLLIDFFSGGLHGLFTLLYIIVFCGIYMSCRFFSLQHPKGQLLIVSLAVLLKNIMFFVILAVFSQKVVMITSFVWMSIGSIVVSGLTAPIFFFLFDRMIAASEENAPAL